MVGGGGYNYQCPMITHTQLAIRSTGGWEGWEGRPSDRQGGDTRCDGEPDGDEHGDDDDDDDVP